MHSQDPGCHGMNGTLNVWRQLLAELEALQKDALVARLQHSSLLQVLLRDVTANEARIWGSLPPREAPRLRVLEPPLRLPGAHPGSIVSLLWDFVTLGGQWGS